MKRVVAIAFVAVLAIGVGVFLGCGGSDNKGTGDVKKSTDSGSPKSGELKAIDVKETSTLKGKVTFKGTPPVAAALPIDASHKDKNHCLDPKASDDEKTDPTWRVGPDGGVANVVVWVRAPKGSFFKLSDSLRKPDRPIVEIKQPHCAFIPHVDVMFPDYFTDAKGKPESTGQQLKVINNAPMTHNTKYTPSDSLLNPSGNPNLDAGKEIEIAPIVSGEKPNRESKYTFNCTIHQWMNGHVWLFDHPFAKVTGKEGTFEFKVPADNDVDVVYWHESMATPKVLKTIKVPAGKEETAEIQVSK